MVYLFIFWIHFKILIYSGPGDTFMSPAFQETLRGNELLLNSQGTLARPLSQSQACGDADMLYWTTIACDYRTTVLRYGHFQAQGYQDFLALAPGPISSAV